MPDIKVFRISDLVSKRIQVGGDLGIASVGYIGPDVDPTDFSPATPYIMVATVADKIRVLDGVDVAKLTPDVLDSLAVDIGRAVVSSAFFPGTALCAQDAPTCAANPTISPIASSVESITNIDLGLLRSQLSLTLERLDSFEKSLASQSLDRT